MRMVIGGASAILLWGLLFLSKRRGVPPPRCCGALVRPAGSKSTVGRASLGASRAGARGCNRGRLVSGGWLRLVTPDAAAGKCGTGKTGALAFCGYLASSVKAPRRVGLIFVALGDASASMRVWE